MYQRKIFSGLSFLALWGVLTVNQGLAQTSTDPVLMTVGDKNVTKSEFLSIYMKNNTKAQSTDPKSLEDYVQLFVNFKLKVREAESLGMDTAAAFKSELEGYRKQLAQPYLVDNEVTDMLLKEAYERSKTDVRASHILIGCDANALPKDTLAAYNKAIEARNKILKGESFAKIAGIYSTDPSVKENSGDLGYFTCMQMVYPFESAAYNAEVNKVTMPVRTRFGYHLILVSDKRPNMGNITVAHIMVKTTKNGTPEDSLAAKKKIDEIYGKIQAGENFADLAGQFSDDKGSAKKGGELPMFGTGRMVPEFEKVAFGLTKDSEISKPFQTMYGWHIVKRLSKKEMGSFEEMKNEIKPKIAKDSRSQKSKDSKLNKIKKEYNFSENLKMRDELVKVMDTTFFEGKWKASAAAKMNKEIFNLAGKSYTQTDFAKFLESRQTKRPKTDYGMAVNEAYTNFVNESLLAQEESSLAAKYPEYRALLQEYRDGILLFDLTDKNVWSKAVKDTVGLKSFYEANKNKYLWEKRVKGAVYKCNDEKTAAEVRKMLKGKPKKAVSDEDILKAVNKDSQLNLKIERGTWLKGEQEIVDQFGWTPGLSADKTIDKQIVFVEVESVIEPTPKTLQEAKGMVTADYQASLEKNWLDELRKKYPVKIDQQVLSTIK